METAVAYYNKFNLIKNEANGRWRWVGRWWKKMLTEVEKRNFYALYANLKPNVDISADIWEMIAIYQRDSEWKSTRKSGKEEKALKERTLELLSFQPVFTCSGVDVIYFFYAPCLCWRARNVLLLRFHSALRSTAGFVDKWDASNSGARVNLLLISTRVNRISFGRLFHARLRQLRRISPCLKLRRRLKDSHPADASN